MHRLRTRAGAAGGGACCQGLCSHLGVRTATATDPTDVSSSRADASTSTLAPHRTGGNTFFLWHHLRASGLADLVQRRVLHEGALYVGASAGSIVAGRSIEPALWKGWDDPAAAGPDTDWEESGAYDAMSLAPSVSFFPHYSDEWAALCSSRSAELDHKCVLLTDDGNEAFVMGDEPESAPAADPS